MARCLPRGLPALNSFPGVFTRIVHAPGLIVVLYLADPTFRSEPLDVVVIRGLATNASHRPSGDRAGGVETE
jgi:hypothetical protein